MKINMKIERIMEVLRQVNRNCGLSKHDLNFAKSVFAEHQKNNSHSTDLSMKDAVRLI